MAQPRRHLNATVLPDGKVLVTGGVSGGGFNDLATAVHTAELWDPATDDWTALAPNAVDRGYHSVSLLLPDGTVLHGASGDANIPGTTRRIPPSGTTRSSIRPTVPRCAPGHQPTRRRT